METDLTMLLLICFAGLYYIVYKVLCAMAAYSEKGMNDNVVPNKRNIKRALKAKPGTARYEIVQSRIIFI